MTARSMRVEWQVSSYRDKIKVVIRVNEDSSLFSEDIGFQSSETYAIIQG